MRRGKFAQHAALWLLTSVLAGRVSRIVQLARLWMSALAVGTLAKRLSASRRATQKHQDTHSFKTMHKHVESSKGLKATRLKNHDLDVPRPSRVAQRFYKSAAAKWVARRMGEVAVLTVRSGL